MNKMQYELQSYLFLYPSNAITKHLLKSQDIKLKKHVDGRNLKKTCPPEKREKLKKKPLHHLLLLSVQCSVNTAESPDQLQVSKTTAAASDSCDVSPWLSSQTLCRLRAVQRLRTILSKATKNSSTGIL
jgi:hypothetical protein